MSRCWGCAAGFLSRHLLVDQVKQWSSGSALQGLGPVDAAVWISQLD